MSSKEITLAVSAFADSTEAARLSADERKSAQEIVRLFVEICYESLGKIPRLLDGHDMHEALGHAMPARMAKKDPRAKHVPAILEAYLDHLEASQVVPGAFELRRGFESTVPEFLEVVRTGKSAHHHAGPPQAPVVYGAPKTGRNDPCSCGSGKKFKKCHGKGAPN